MQYTPLPHFSWFRMYNKNASLYSHHYEYVKIRKNIQYFKRCASVKKKKTLLRFTYFSSKEKQNSFVDKTFHHKVY